MQQGEKLWDYASAPRDWAIKEGKQQESNNNQQQLKTNQSNQHQQQSANQLSIPNFNNFLIVNSFKLIAFYAFISEKFVLLLS